MEESIQDEALERAFRFFLIPQEVIAEEGYKALTVGVSVNFPCLYGFYPLCFALYSSYQKEIFFYLLFLQLTLRYLARTVTIYSNVHDVMGDGIVIGLWICPFEFGG